MVKKFNPNKLFLTDECQDVLALYIKCKANVTDINNDNEKVRNHSGKQCLLNVNNLYI